MRFKPVILSFITLISLWSSKPPRADGAETNISPGGFLLSPAAPQDQLYGDFSGNPRAEQFIDRMVVKHQFNRQQLVTWLSQTRRLDYVLRLMDRQAPDYRPPARPTAAWLRYRKKFITVDNIQNGVNFWNQYQSELAKAERQYGVPAEIIVGILGIETRWGRMTGHTRIMDALATLAFDYPRRAAYFETELETFLLMSRSEQDNPLVLQGSIAGAMGYGQFMPSAYKHYAVDFNGDGRINLWDPVDMIGSVAHYFQKNGWKSGETVAVVGEGSARGLKDGFATSYSVRQLARAGLTPQIPLSDRQQVSLIRLDIGTGYQYWFGLPNFTVITHYNHSTHYAMVVWQLGESIKASRRKNL